MHSPIEQVVELELEGKTYALFFSLEAISFAEDASGEALITGLQRKTINAPRISLVRAMLYGCLLPKQPKITLDEAKAMVTQFNWREIWAKVLEAWTTGMRKPKADEDDDPSAGQG